jgi:hypothetical protein
MHRNLQRAQKPPGGFSLGSSSNILSQGIPETLESYRRRGEKEVEHWSPLLRRVTTSVHMRLNAPFVSDQAKLGLAG